MALIGTYRKGHYENSEEAQEVQVTVPEDFADENHPYYQKRGETFTEMHVLPQWVVDEEIENAYVVIKAIAIHLEDDHYPEEHIDETYGKRYRVNIMYHIYLSERDRKLNFNDFHLMEDASEMIYLDSLEQCMPNPIEWAYNYVKNLGAFSEMQNA